MKTEDVKKTTSTIFTSSDKSFLLSSVSVSPRQSLRKLQNFLNRGLETTWILPCLLIHADPMQQLPANIIFSTTKNSLTIHSDITLVDKSPEHHHKVLFTILIFLLTAMFGTLTHRCNMMMILIPKNLRVHHEKNMIQQKSLKQSN